MLGVEASYEVDSGVVVRLPLTQPVGREHLSRARLVDLAVIPLAHKHEVRGVVPLVLAEILVEPAGRALVRLETDDVGEL